MQNYIDRLVKAGIPYACADEIVTQYWKDDDLDGLNRYISLIEKGFTVCQKGGELYV